MAKRKKKGWSYNAGEKGRNWVRAYLDQRGKYYLEYFEEGPHPETGKVVRKRKRVLLKGVSNAATAVQRAETLAQQFAELEPDSSGPLTLRGLFALYLKEVTPTKAKKTQEHDHRAVRMFLAFFGANTEPTSLGRVKYNAFIKARREGTIPGHRPVKDRTVEADVKLLIAVFNWASVERETGEVLMERNPWKGFPVPSEKNPSRPVLTDEIMETLCKHSPDWRFSLALILARETGRRLSAVRRLRWSDVNLEEQTIRWAPEHDKNRRGRVTPVTDRAAAALRQAPRGIGDAWVFPAPLDDTQPCTKDTMVQWMKRTRKRTGLNIRGLGFHSAKRAKVRDPRFRALPPKIQEALVDTNHETLNKVYDDVGLDDLREAVAEADRRYA